MDTPSVDQPSVTIAHPAVTVDPQPGTTPTIQPVPVQWHAKRSSLGPIFTLFFLLFITLPLAVVFVSQQKGSTSDIRSKAALCMKCGAGVCPNGLKYGEDACAAVSSCDQRVAQICGTTVTNKVATPTPIPPSQLTVIAGSISGKICRDTVKDAGAVFFFNIKRRTLQFVPVTQNQATYTKRLIPGSYAVQFQSDVNEKPLGYTDALHNLLIVDVGLKKDIKNIDVCDEKSVSPGDNFQPESLTL